MSDRPTCHICGGSGIQVTGYDADGADITRACGACDAHGDFIDRTPRPAPHDPGPGPFFDAHVCSWAAARRGCLPDEVF